MTRTAVILLLLSFVSVANAANTILFPVLAGGATTTQAGGGAGDRADEVWNTMAIIQTGINDGTIPSTYGLTIDHSSLSTQSDMCDSAKVEAALNSALFLFLPDQEGFDLFVCGAATESKAKIKSWVEGGGHMFMGKSDISSDVDALNAIFGWDLSKAPFISTTFSRNDVNAAGTVFETMAPPDFQYSGEELGNCGTTSCLPIFTEGSAGGTDTTKYFLAKWNVGNGTVWHQASGDPFNVCPAAQVTFPWGDTHSATCTQTDEQTWLMNLFVQLVVELAKLSTDENSTSSWLTPVVIAAFVVAGVLAVVLSIIACAWCCKCCCFKRKELAAQQVVMMQPGYVMPK